MRKKRKKTPTHSGVPSLHYSAACAERQDTGYQTYVASKHTHPLLAPSSRTTISDVGKRFGLLTSSIDETRSLAILHHPLGNSCIPNLQSTGVIA